MHPTPGEHLGNFDDRNWGVSAIGANIKDHRFSCNHLDPRRV